MIPVALTTERLVLDQPTVADATLITEYCRDPLFERYLSTPWPYERSHAVHFVEQFVPIGWEDDREYTWAIRSVSGDFLGMVGFRRERSDLGYWLGAPHRGRGFMTEAVTAVVDWVFERSVPAVAWECMIGNLASASVARKLGFTFSGVAPAEIPARDGSLPPSWHGRLGATDDRTVKDGWPLT